MDILSLRAGMNLADADYPARVERLIFLARVRDGQQYDHIPIPFSCERTPGGAYIKLCDRRPSVRTGLCRTVVDDAVSLLFSEARFPAIHSKNEKLRGAAQALVRESALCELMNEAAVKGSIGSVSILMRVLGGRVFFEVMDSTYLTPIWNPQAPDTLLRVTERYKVKGAELAALGYEVDEAETYWFQRIWDTSTEMWFWPISLVEAADGKKAALDDGRTVVHGLGFVPMVWIRNLPGGDKIDGVCTFEAAISTVMEMDYQFSQAGRGLKYAADPTLLIKEPAAAEGDTLIRSASEALVVSEKGDAKLLEISGTAAAAVIEYVRQCREIALESMHGNRTNVDKLNGAQSGRAFEMMNQGLIWLADKLRISYGQRGILCLVKMVFAAARQREIRVAGAPLAAFDTSDLSLIWPRYFPPTYNEKFQEAQAYRTLFEGGLISRQRAVSKMASDNDVEDVAEEEKLIDADIAARTAREKVQAADRG
ncbi:MAG TPA: phage portal protein [Acidocella sp.]|nr:phage portal protein [Acidocella sp.]